MKRKGFTLIELLAVIVVLAIIALIATPIVMNVIKKANEGATERSADNYLKAVETLIATEQLDGTPLVDGRYTIESDGTLKGNGETYTVEVSGTKPVGGTVVITNGQVVKNESTIEYTDHTVKFENGKAEAAEKGESSSELAELCDFLEEDTHNANRNPNTIGAKYSCNLGNETRNFYILEAGTSSKPATLILEGNFDNSTQKWCASGADIACAASGLTTKLNEIVAAWSKLDASQINIPSISQISVADGKGENGFIELMFDGSPFSEEWLYSYPGNDSWGISAPYGYWTSSPDMNLNAWIVNYNGCPVSYYVGNHFDYGVRPIITLSI